MNKLNIQNPNMKSPTNPGETLAESEQRVLSTLAGEAAAGEPPDINTAIEGLALAQVDPDFKEDLLSVAEEGEAVEAQHATANVVADGAWDAPTKPIALDTSIKTSKAWPHGHNGCDGPNGCDC